MSAAETTFIRKLLGILEIQLKFENVTGLIVRYPLAKAKVGGIDIMPMIVQKYYEGVGIELSVPYIPGSSFKGRMRSLLELYLALPLWDPAKKIFQHIVPPPRPPRQQPTQEELIRIRLFSDYSTHAFNQLFGINAVHFSSLVEIYTKQPNLLKRKPEEYFRDMAPTRLYVEDFFPSEEYVSKLYESKKALGLLLTQDDFLEHKPENRIDRITSAADPRDILRIRPGVEFSGKVSIVFFDCDYDSRIQEYLKLFVTGLELIEDTYIGGAGSRGYGRIRFKNIKLILKRQEYYEGVEDPILIGEYNSLKNLRANLSNIISTIKSHLEKTYSKLTSSQQ